MDRYAIVSAGVVTDVVFAATAPVREHEEVVLATALPVAVGWRWDWVTFTHPEGKEITLDLVQRLRYAEIDGRTDAIIQTGFEFPPASGQRFELSLEAQARMNALLVLASNPLMQYPIIWNMIDDDGSISLPDASTAIALCLTAVAAVRAILDSGSTLKTGVRAATTIEDAMSVIDER